jgi:hypothetical protein
MDAVEDLPDLLKHFPFGDSDWFRVSTFGLRVSRGHAAPAVAIRTAPAYARPMITAKQIRELLEAKPFKPFRICMSDGSHYDITNHDAAFVGKNTVEIGLNLDPDGFAEYFARCSILHITKLEDLPETVAR